MQKKPFALSCLTLACLSAFLMTAQTTAQTQNNPQPALTQPTLTLSKKIADEYIVIFKQDTSEANIQRIRDQI